MTLRHRAEDQPLPTPNDKPHCHDDVVKYLTAVWVDHPMTPHLVTMVEDRKRLGTARYGTPLQPFNGRDFLRDLLEELTDGLAYAAGMTQEGVGGEYTQFQLNGYVRDLTRFALFVRQLMHARDGV